MTEIFNFLTDVFKDCIAMAPMIVLIIGALLAPLVYMLTKNKYVITIFSLIFIGLAFAIDVVFLMESGATIQSFDYLFVANTFSALMSVLFLIVGAMVIWISIDSPETTKHKGEFYSILLIAITGMIAVASSTNLLTIFIGVETVSIMSYAMVTMKKNDPRASEAAVKYLIIGGLSSALTLFGISMLFGITGHIDIIGIAHTFSQYEFGFPMIIAVVCLIAGWGFKISAVPFHAWAPDVYEGAATPVSTFLAIGSKKMGFVVFFKLFMALAVFGAVGFGGADNYVFRHLFALVAIVTMTLGNLVAIQQTSMKRMLAYSSIAQAGYIMIALAVMSNYAMAAGMFHMFTHVVMKGGLFIIVTAFIAVGLGDKIADYRGLAKRAPFIAFAMMLFLFSLAGIPPLAGFTSKFFLFSSTMMAEQTWPILLIVALINSAISLYYYVRIVKAMYIDKPLVDTPVKLKNTHLAAIILCVVFVIVLGVYPDPFFDWCMRAADLFLLPFI